MVWGEYWGVCERDAERENENHTWGKYRGEREARKAKVCVTVTNLILSVYQNCEDKWWKEINHLRQD